MKRIIFISGTRADYGKMKPLMKAVEASKDLEAYIYVSGMHLLEKYGNTYGEIQKDGYSNIHLALGQNFTSSMSYNMGIVVCDLTGYVNHIHPDLIIVHGDRIDALAGAVVGALNNIRVAHVEGGEVSGTIDESIRHAISKFAHIHFVSTEIAKQRLIQMGENRDSIFVIGSPDIDVMLSPTLPSIEKVKLYYDISFEKYAIFMYHPVVTELKNLGKKVETVMNAVLRSNLNYVVIYPNNDPGSEIILDQLYTVENNKRFRLFPSIRFEYFLTLLKNADFIIGNSSAGIREAGVYGVPTIDIGSRQRGRYDMSKESNIQWTEEKESSISMAISNVNLYRKSSQMFGDGDSTKRFMDALQNHRTWNLPIQKSFIDIL